MKNGQRETKRVRLRGCKWTIDRKESKDHPGRCFYSASSKSLCCSRKLEETQLQQATASALLQPKKARDSQKWRKNSTPKSLRRCCFSNSLNFLGPEKMWANPQKTLKKKYENPYPPLPFPQKKRFKKMRMSNSYLF